MWILEMLIWLGGAVGFLLASGQMSPKWRVSLLLMAALFGMFALGAPIWRFIEADWVWSTWRILEAIVAIAFSYQAVQAWMKKD